MSVAIANKWMGFIPATIAPTGHTTRIQFEDLAVSGAYPYVGTYPVYLQNIRKHYWFDSVTLDWGDGTTDVQTDITAAYTHGYETSGPYALEIDDTVRAMGLFNSASASTDFTGGVSVLDFGHHIESLTDYAFCYCTNLKSLAGISYSKITKVGAYAFYHASGAALTSLSFLPSTVKSIGNYAFQSSSLVSVSGFPSVEEVSSDTGFGMYMFSNCSQLTSVSGLPSAIKRISVYNMFSACSGLTSVAGLPSGLTEIGGNMFAACQGLTSVAGLPAGVTEIPYECFYNCQGLTSLSSSEIPNIRTLGYNAFYNCNNIASLNLTLPVYVGQNCFRGNATITSAVLTGVTGFGSNSMAACFGLSGDLNIPNAENVNSEAFYNCHGLTSVTAPSLHTIGTRAFSGSGVAAASRNNLVTVTIDDIQSIGANAFRYNCSSTSSTTGSVIQHVYMRNRSYKQALNAGYSRNLSNFPWGLAGGCTIHFRDGTIKMKSVSTSNYTLTQTATPRYSRLYDGVAKIKVRVPDTSVTYRVPWSMISGADSWASQANVYDTGDGHCVACTSLSAGAFDMSFAGSGVRDIEIDDLVYNLDFENSALKLIEWTETSPKMWYQFASRSFYGQDELTDVYLTSFTKANVTSRGRVSVDGVYSLWGAHSAVKFHCSDGVIYGDLTEE